MSERGGTQIPWASLAVVVAFVSSTLLVPKAFDLLRPSEKERAQPFSGADLEVDARLWEDPFVAIRRHEADRVERCKNAALASKRECDDKQREQRRSPQTLRAHLDANNDGQIDAQTTLLMAVLVPGNPFVGAEESRRRTRMALLAGLQAEGYFPDSAEQIGLMQVPLAPVVPPAPLIPPKLPKSPKPGALPAPAAGSMVPAPPSTAASAAAADQLQIPYELLSRNRNLRVDDDSNAAESAPASERAPFLRVAVVWVDESALPGPKLDGVARVLEKVVDCKQKICPRLVVLGPSSSDGLNVALQGLQAALQRRILAPDSIDDALANGYRLLADAHFYSPAATISERDLPLLRRYQLTLQDFLTGYFAGIVPERGQRSAAERQVHFTRTVAADDTVITLLASEVLQRLPVSSKRRIVTIVESDSIYARGLETRFRGLLDKGSQISRIDQAYFFRGIDGVTLRDTPDRQAPTTKASSGASTVEWPEARDQLDYLRRMADELKRSESAEGGGPIGAIGIFANDVHDKLLVLQALHDTFPDKVFFTTDLDARYMHPRALPFTRNLVVASSLPLQLPPQLVAGPDQHLQRAGRQVQEGTPPMRDMYQTATYLAARLAACRRLCGAVQKTAQAAIASPTVYEIGRSQAVAISGFDAKAQLQQHPAHRTAGALAAAMGLLLVGLLGWPSTPALRHARQQWLQWPAASGPPPEKASRMAALLTVLYGVWLGYTAASLMEAVAPGSLGLGGAGLWALLGGLAAVLLAPGLRAAVGPADTPRAALAVQAVSLLLLMGLLFYAGSQADDPLPGQGEPLLWLEGISGWPSHFLHLLAMLAVLVAVDVYWQRARDLGRTEPAWLGLQVQPMAQVPPDDGPAWARAAQAAQDWLRRHALAAWRLPAKGSVCFETVWQRYQQLSLPLPRVVRVLFWYAVTVSGATLLFVVLTDRYVPEVPVRGIEHRAIIVTGLVLALALLPALVVAVADATVATCRFMLALGRGRTLYPPNVVARFASELGGEHATLLALPIAAEPARRDANPPPAAHSLLDDWIDIQIVARQTQAVAPLIVAPFIVLALLVMARSRLFDNWALTWPIALTAAAYLLWLAGLAVALKVTAERLRSDALARMQADLRWLAGAPGGRDKLVEPYKRLITAVENNTTGAFAATFDQPLVTSLMVPLGGAGGVQLLDYLLLAR